MSSYNARLRLPGQSRIPIGVEVDISDERITLRTGDREVARWSLETIDVSLLADGFHIVVDGEEVVLSVTEPGRFASELGIQAERPAPRPVTPPTSPEDDLRRRVSRLATDLVSDRVAPEAAFAEWLGLLRELNTRHTRGLIATPLFHELNTRLLDLFSKSDA